MAAYTKQSIGIGTVAGDKTGDGARTGAIKINDNFDVLFSAFSIDSITFDVTFSGAFAGPIAVDDTTDSTSTITGSIQTDGGLGVAKTIVVGTGIKLGGTAAANLLDDYEEGTFTPEVADAITGGNIASTSTAAGSYTKVGNLVKCAIRLDNIDTTGLTAGNLLYVRGFPFMSKTGTARHYGTVTVVNSVTFSGYLSIRIGPGSSEGLLFDNTSGASAGILLISALSSGVSDLELEISYLV